MKSKSAAEKKIAELVARRKQRREDLEAILLDAEKGNSMDFKLTA